MLARHIPYVFDRSFESVLVELPGAQLLTISSFIPHKLTYQSKVLLLVLLINQLLQLGLMLLTLLDPHSLLVFAPL